MIRHAPLLSAGLSATIAFATGARAQEIVLYDGNDETQPFLSGDDDFAGGFTYDDFTGVAVADGPDAFTIAANDDLDGSNGIFGGVGRDVTGGAAFDAAHSTATATFRPHAAAPGVFRLILQDAAHQFQYDLDLDDTEPAGDGYRTATVPLGAGDPADATDDQIAYVGRLDGSPGPPDAVPAYGLTQWQLQAEFGTPDPIHVEIRRIAINDPRAIPEPG